MSSRWTHAICGPCWTERNPERRPVTVNVTHREDVLCCFCSARTRDGIFVRENPGLLPCHGHHERLGGMALYRLEEET